MCIARGPACSSPSIPSTGRLAVEGLLGHKGCKQKQTTRQKKEEANSSGTFRSPSIYSRKRNLEADAGRTLIRLGITSVKTIVPTSSPIQRVCNWLFVITTGMSVRMSQVDSISPEVLALCCAGVLYSEFLLRLLIVAVFGRPPADFPPFSREEAYLLLWTLP